MPILGLATSGDLNRLEKKLMASLESIAQAAAEETAEVKAHVDAAAAEIKALREQLANGQQVTPEQLQTVEDSIRNIFTTPATPDAGNEN